MNKRTNAEMPQIGQRVYVLEEGANYGKRGRVLDITDYNSGRPYTVELSNGATRKFRQADVFKPTQIDWS
ncbi:MAG: hypothetical protein ACXABY_35740 [Candidatus Thorarchaeota archaeon]|jgi:hypothetical protein